MIGLRSVKRHPNFPSGRQSGMINEVEIITRARIVLKDIKSHFYSEDFHMASNR
jgi:hypothetical protein